MDLNPVASSGAPPVVVTLTGTPVARRLADLLGAPLHARAGRAEGDASFDDAPEHLRAAGRLRVANKQASLDELGRLSDPPLTKDAIAGRIRRLLAMADRRAEELGYRRVWYDEHHNMSAIASSATSVLIAHVAAHTSTIRLGSGGVVRDPALRLLALVGVAAAARDLGLVLRGAVASPLPSCSPSSASSVAPGPASSSSDRGGAG